MAHRAVFMDRDRTLILDPGYISDPSAVKLLPGVELAIKSLQQAGYKIVVVTNQSGVARGLITEEALQMIHAELRRQLSDKGVHLDGIYYCPYHPAGTVEKYAKESQLRKPQPGMLLKAASEMGIDLVSSWMVGDSARDVEAGQRAGCRTIRVRLSNQHLPAGANSDDEGVQADHVVRNLVDAAKVILRQGPRETPPPKAQVQGKPQAPSETHPSEDTLVETIDDSKVRQEILQCVRQIVAERQSEEFSFTRVLAGVVQMLGLLALGLTFLRMLSDEIPAASLWALIALVLQVMALTFFMMQRQR